MALLDDCWISAKPRDMSFRSIKALSAFNFIYCTVKNDVTPMQLVFPGLYVDIVDYKRRLGLTPSNNWERPASNPEHLGTVAMQPQ